MNGDLVIMKKYLTALLVIIMLLAMVGCSFDEIGMYSLMKEASQLNSFETNGTVSVSLKGQLFDEMLQDLTLPNEIKSVLKSGFEIRYNIQESKNPMEYQIAIEFRKIGESDFKKVTTLIVNENVMYVKFGDLINFIKPYISSSDPDDVSVMNEITAKIDYLKIDLKSGNSTAIYSNDVTNIQNEKLIKLITEFEDVFKDAFKDFSSGTIAKKDNGYEFMLDAKDVQLLIGNFVGYVYDNIDSIYSVVATKINDLTDDEMKTIQDVYPSIEVKKADIISGLKEIKDSVKETTPQEIDGIKNDSSLKETLKSIDGSYFRYYLGKSGDNVFDISTTLKVKYGDEFTVEMNQTAKTTKLDSFSINKPVNYTTIDGFRKIVSSIIPPKVNIISINSITGKALLSYTNGTKTETTIPLILIDHSNYAPMNVMAKIFNEKVGWNSVKQTAYIDRSGKITEMNGFMKNGVAYIKIRAFEKLDYLVFSSNNEIHMLKFVKRSIFEDF